MKYITTLVLALASTALFAQENNQTYERPSTEITVGVSNLKQKTSIEDLYYYDYYDYGYYVPFNYLTTNQPSINIGLRQKIKSGAIRIQGEYGSSNQTYNPQTDPAYLYTQLEKYTLSSFNAGGKIGYDFFKSHKIIELNYGADFIFDYSNLKATNYYSNNGMYYDPATGQYLMGQDYTISENYKTVSYGIGLNLGIGLRLSEKIKVGIESNLRFLMSNQDGKYKNDDASNYISEKNSSKFSKTDAIPLGLLYLAFGF